MGIPGESRAVEIAARNGLPVHIITKARGYLDEERSDISLLISSLREKHRELDTAAQKSRSEEKRLREERREADLKALRLRQKEAEIKAGAAGKFRQLLSESRRTLENLVREVREGELTREKTLKVKEFLSELERTAASEDAALELEEKALAEEMRRGNDHTGEIEPGAEVLAGERKRRGTVLRQDKKDSWIVEIGSVKMTFSEKDLSVLQSREEKPSSSPHWAADLAEAPAAQAELSLRGMRLEEAIEALRRQIDAAALQGLKEFAVIHGKGDGILQRGVHEYLRNETRIADYFFSRPEMGGFGRTEVVLK
jgi:DNA mismatch repair protein MutS2